MPTHELYFACKPNLKHLRVFDNIPYVHVPDEKWKKLDTKVEKYILVDYWHEQKGYTCYNPRMKQVRVSCDVVFDKSKSWYSLPSPTPDDPIPITKDEASEAEMIREEEEEDVGTLEESPISFRLSGPNEELVGMTR